MKSYFLNGRMALKRKTSCVLTILFAAVATVFLLFYPVFIESTRTELAFAYDTLQVSGWIMNGRGYTDPTLQGDLWHPLVDSGYLSEYYAYSIMEIRWFDSPALAAELDENAPLKEQEKRFSELVQEHRRDTTSGQILGLNATAANGDLLRQQEELQWLTGWSEERFYAGADMVCLVPQHMGYDLGQRLPFLMENFSDRKSVFWAEVVGTYPISLTSADLVVPIQTLETMCQSREKWTFWVNGFHFMVEDNHQLDPLKDLILELGLDGSNSRTSTRVAIDDRTLDGTVAPIKSNLAMLEGLYRFFFLVVAAIGFFLCFLLARGRKQEYAVMRLLGEPSAQITLKALLEQLLLCLLGIALGAGLLGMTGQGAIDPVTCGIILVCYTLGAAIAVMLTVRVNVMEILRDKE